MTDRERALIAAGDMLAGEVVATLGSDRYTIREWRKVRESVVGVSSPPAAQSGEGAASHGDPQPDALGDKRHGGD